MALSNRQFSIDGQWSNLSERSGIAVGTSVIISTCTPSFPGGPNGHYGYVRVAISNVAPSLDTTGVVISPIDKPNAVVSIDEPEGAIWAKTYFHDTTLVSIQEA